MEKTYKREVAVAQLFLHWLLVMIIVWVVYNKVEVNVDTLINLATGLAVWVYGFAGAAFGLDAFAKQIKFNG